MQMQITQSTSQAAGQMWRDVCDHYGNDDATCSSHRTKSGNNKEKNMVNPQALKKLTFKDLEEEVNKLYLKLSH